MINLVYKNFKDQIHGYFFKDGIVFKSEGEDQYPFLSKSEFQKVYDVVEFQYLNKAAKSISDAIIEDRKDNLYFGFFETPECIPPFKNIIFQYGKDRLVWFLDITNSEKEDGKKYALLFFPPIAASNNKCFERLDLFVSNDFKFTLGDSYVKTYEGKPSLYTYIDKINPLVMSCSILKLLSIINCKNIEIIEHKSKKQFFNKKIRRKNFPMVSYYTIGIKPTGKRQEHQSAQGLWDNRIHLCRGHFKTYTEQNPLFGRITGRFWWQPSVRGRNHDGIIIKDYVVKT